MKKSFFQNAGTSGNCSVENNERTFTAKELEPVIMSNSTLIIMNDEQLDSYFQCLSMYIQVLGGSKEVVDAIFRTSILLGMRTAESEIAKMEKFGKPSEQESINVPEINNVWVYDDWDVKKLATEIEKYLLYFEQIGIDLNIPATFGYIYRLFVNRVVED